MATNNKIGRFTERMEALVRRRWGRLTLESLTDEGWAKIEQRIKPVQRRTDYAHLSDDALLRASIDAGILTPADFKRRTGR